MTTITNKEQIITVLKEKCRAISHQIACIGDNYIEHILTGSLLPSLVSGFDPNDIDIYFRSSWVAEEFAYFIDTIHKDKISHIILQTTMKDENDQYIPGNEETYSEYKHNVSIHSAIKTKPGTFGVEKPIQFILFKTGSGEMIIKTFDLSIVQWFYDASVDELVISDKCWEDNINKIMDPTRTLNYDRYLKYKNRGYNQNRPIVLKDFKGRFITAEVEDTIEIIEEKFNLQNKIEPIEDYLEAL